MKILLVLSALVALSNGFCNTDSKNIERKLKNDILCNYKKDERPNQQTLPIELNYVVHGFNFEESKSELEVQAKILFRWDDLRLRWEESQYDGIQMIHVKSTDVWVPELFFNDSHHHYGIGTCHETECLIKSSGQASCRFPCLQTVTCDADYFDWPYDVHQCKAVFKTFLEYEEVVFDPNQLGGFIMKNSNKEWRLQSVNGSINLDQRSMVNFVFQIQRFSGTIFKHVVVPGYILITISLMILWMDPTTMWRVIFCGVNIYLHFTLMDRIWWQFPTNGVARNVPRILKYMVFMLIMSTIILLQSIIFRVLFIRYPLPPQWIQKITEVFENNSILKHFLYSYTEARYAFETLKEEEEVQKPEETDDNTEEIQVAVPEPPKPIKINSIALKNKKKWLNFYRLIDRMMFIIFSICYAIYDGY